MHQFEKLGAFYLGKEYDVDEGQIRDNLLLYDSRDLTTHAVCVGMTGSGKTGLCLSLLEEAAIDGVPAIAIDPKGDLGNLLLAFPELTNQNFRPWVDESAAARNGQTPEEYAASVAELWRDGLASWGQDGERIQRFKDAVDLSIYTPGSNSGLPLTVLRSFDAPPTAVLEDTDAFRERVASAASGLLALLGISADPVRSREHILLSNILDQAWQAGRNLDIASLIREIQSPPFKQIGIFDLDAFFPADDRMELCMQLNNLLASPSFASWMEGEPLNIKRLLYTDQGKPRLTIISIAHLSESERMFFVTILLNEILTWVRTQPGTTSLRALLYMDEVMGYFPPVAAPPSKAPMLTLLKQARAYGLGIVLATQNPVDLDYKGLSNTGTWFLGRLQTERDKARILDGLEGASASSGNAFDRQRMETILSGLKGRVFVLNNVHEDEPVVFHTRWAMSYLAGPLTRTQIQTLMEPRKAALSPAEEKLEAVVKPTAAPAAGPEAASPTTKSTASNTEPSSVARPVLPPDVKQQFVQPNRPTPTGSSLVFRPGLLGIARLHFARVSYKTDCWVKRSIWAIATEDRIDEIWDKAPQIRLQSLAVSSAVDELARFTPLPGEFQSEKQYSSWSKDFKKYLYRSQKLSIWRSPLLKAYSEVEEEEDDFRIRLTQLAREQRDLKIEKLRSKYGARLATAQDRIRSAEAALKREKAQYKKATFDSAISFGSSILGALFGRKIASKTNVSKAATSMRSVGRARQQHGDIGPAEEKLEDCQQDLKKLEEEFEVELKELEQQYDPMSLEIEELTLAPRKTDMEVVELSVLWMPWFVDSIGIATPGFEADSLATN